jgi:hypothetical protein
MQPDERRGDGRAQLHRLGARAALGRQDRRARSTSTEAERSSTRTTTALKKVKERILEYLAVQALVRSSRARSCASWARPASARPRSPRASRAPPGASSCASRSAACATRPRSAATGAPTSAPCRARSSSRSQGRHQQPGLPARRGRQDVDGLPRRPGGGAARGARPRAEPHLQRPLPRPRLRPVRRDVRARPTPSRDPAAAAGPHGDHRAPGYTEFEKLNIAVQYLVPKQKDQRPRGRRRHLHRERLRTIIHHYTKESGVRTSSARSAACAARSRGGAQGGPRRKSFRSPPSKFPSTSGVPKYRYRARPTRRTRSA